MSYVVLARKLRPNRFEDLIGQETISRTLRNAVTSGRVAHAFLFSGSRGVGKTSAARILTKALNCLAPEDGNPCGKCGNCIEITENASPDVYEIDAASNRGIENIRELRDNVQYAPAQCRYKVYIIDEAHMLTLESFNALLKTLEEPPSHVKFILATTDPHKLPQTIISRCQRYDFVRVPLQQMADFLEKVTLTEQLSISRRALEIISRQAVGGMRDALTMIDQVLSFSGDNAKDEEVLEILVDASAMEAYGLDPNVVTGLVKENNQLVTAGAIDDGGGRLLVKVPGVIETIDDLINMPIKASDGTSIKFGDVAVVRRDGPRDARHEAAAVRAHHRDDELAQRPAGC